MRQKWYEITSDEHFITPSLVVHPDRIQRNIETMIRMAGGHESLRPHVKTYKMAEVIEMQLRMGIDKFKCATIAEAELLASCGAKDVLLAMQPVGASIPRLFKLIDTFQNTTFSTLVDNIDTLGALERSAMKENVVLDVWLDINNGMNRTGILPDDSAIACYRALYGSGHLKAKGFHVYDGHIRNVHFEERKKRCNEAFEQVEVLKENIENLGMEVGNIVAGGSPTFPVHCLREGVQKSPGTVLLWDQGYSDILPESDFLCAAVLTTRIISKPASGLICLDLGHKSVAPEMPFPRVKFQNLDDACQQIKHSEEHLVIACENPKKYKIGDLFYAIPYHICPTVAKYDEVYMAKNHKIAARWKVAARGNKISI
ncbi:D-TA family PLP-dependent enzyme [Allomuricauda sp. SCSIO 65647]|uniref:D-TA family PLP-dependent enzyme n=1 Tax=Allomuricauda sp. SCSIO 65647 TaxID=2908843 RepID=UPI001F323F81|nr:D-TA family PLP-dependent enzyme [Muricauda sp. SCSIO 65647]UJH67578.1 D-TA family PLP-dependent enzyme [Muricauda sp. SCSIO 65647]